MPHDVNWSVDAYREEFESEEHWKLRKDFMEKWKHNYAEERLVCLARVFANIELLGCRYPPEVMKEVASLSEEVVKSYRQKMKNKLKRTFVSASDAAEDRAKGVKRQGGVVIDAPAAKTSKIAFVPQGHKVKNAEEVEIASDEEQNSDKDEAKPEATDKDELVKSEVTPKSVADDAYDYLKEMLSLKCLDLREFHESLFQTVFGSLVLLIRPWTSRLGNIQASCAACHLKQQGTFEQGTYKFTINDRLVAQATGPTKAEARSIVETMAWNRMREECVSVVIKEQWIAQGDARITTDEFSRGQKADQFGTPIESSVATKMMKMMGWAGGGLGADAQGIAEPIKPHLQMVNLSFGQTHAVADAVAVNRAGLGSSSANINQFRRSATALFQRYMSSECLDVDLVFSCDFSKEERAALHQLARRSGLASSSYGKDADRFMVVKKKLNPFALVKAVLDKGGVTPKYQVFIPKALRNRRR